MSKHNGLFILASGIILMPTIAFWWILFQLNFMFYLSFISFIAYLVLLWLFVIFLVERISDIKSNIFVLVSSVMLILAIVVWWMAFRLQYDFNIILTVFIIYLVFEWIFIVMLIENTQSWNLTNIKAKEI